jgi:hypothetical protein
MALLALGASALAILGCGDSASQQATGRPDPEPAGSTVSFEDVSCPSSTRCIAVGAQQQSGKGFVKEWDGSRWETIGDAQARLRAISCPTEGWCMAIGNSPPEGWSLERSEASESAEWKMRQLSLPHAKSWSELLLNDVSCTGKRECTAAGVYSDSSYKNYAARWDGRRWTRERPPNPNDGTAASTHGMLGVSCPSTDFCATVGAFKWLPLIQQWDGSRWKIVSAPHPEGSHYVYLESVFCTSPRSCMAVGSATTGKSTGPFAEQWNGRRWLIVKTPPFHGQGTGALHSVFCLSESSCAAVGSTTSTGQSGSTITMSWDGNRWTRRHSPDPKPYSQLAAVSCSTPRLCMAVGQAGADWGTGRLLSAKLTGLFPAP